MAKTFIVKIISPYKDMRYLWLSDIHLNFFAYNQVIEFLSKIEKLKGDGIIISGDISTGNRLSQDLRLVAQKISSPIYFVLGNHDYYHSSIKEVRDNTAFMCRIHGNLKYLNNEDLIHINDEIAIIGDDGWYDGRWREPLTSLVFTYDFSLIKDFRRFSFSNRLEMARHLAEIAAFNLRKKLLLALKKYTTVYLVTHYPPWPEKNQKLGIIAEKFWAPYNSSKIIAETLQSIMDERPTQKLVVMAGHVHMARYEKITKNIDLMVKDSSHRKLHEPSILHL